MVWYRGAKKKRGGIRKDSKDKIAHEQRLMACCRQQTNLLITARSNIRMRNGGITLFLS
jgi:hypothetical protein